MKGKITLALIIMTGLCLSCLDSFSQTAEDLMPKALQLEEVKGELEEAIKVYQKIVKDFPENRPIAAKAQLHIGLCYEKLGNQEAKKAYNQVIKNYGDQKDIAITAQERLSRLILIAEELENIPMIPKFTKVQIPSEFSWDAALSPDGQKILLASDEQLWLMPLSGNLGSDLPGKPEKINTDGIKVLWAGLSWSGDGRSIAFNEINDDIWSNDKPENEKRNQNIYIVPTEGGKPKKIIENLCNPAQANYRLGISPDGKVIAYTSANDDEGNIYSVRVDDVKPKKLVETPAREPVFSPDGKMIAYVEDKMLGHRGGGLWVVPASGGNPILISKAGNASSPVWSPDASKIAYLDYFENKKINIIPINKDGRPAGGKTTIDAPEGVQKVIRLAGWSENNKIGTIINRVKYALYTLPADGGQAAVVYQGSASQPRWSPDGKHIIFRKDSDQEAEGWKDHKLAVIPAEGGEDTNILSVQDNQIGFMPYGMGNRLSPDGKYIVISAKKIDVDTMYINHYPITQIWTVSRSGERLSKITNPYSSYSDDSPCWSPDGKSIAFVRSKINEDRYNLYGEMGIYLVNISGGEPELLLKEPEKFIYSINWSPDGKWIAYLRGNKLSSDEPSTLNIINVNDGSSRVVGEVSDFNVFTELAWSPDNKKIAFNDKEGKEIKIISIADGSVKDIKTGLVNTKIYNLDWSPDGKRFVFPGHQGGIPEFWVLENFLPLEKLAQTHEEPKNIEPKGIAISQVWAGPKVDIMGKPSPDGRYISFVDWDSGNLAVYETTTGKIRPVTDNGSWDDPNQFAENSCWSPDGKRIAYAWYNDNNPAFINLYVKGLDGSEPELIYKNEELDWTICYDWSPDGKMILACFANKDATTQIGLVDIASGSMQILKTLGKRMWPNDMRFSPDGRFIAYDLNQDKDTRACDIYLISVIDGNEIKLVAHPSNEILLGWFPDGKNILFGSERNGTMGAWSIGVVEGRPQGTPKMVKPDMGPIESLGFTQNGSYYYGVRKKMNDVYIAEISPSSSDVVAPPQKAIQQFEGYNQAPAYSPDGKFLAYISSRSHLLTRSGFTRGGNILCIKSLETNEIREIRPEIDMIGYPTWSPDGKSIDVVHWNVNDGIELFRIEVETGKVTIISQPDDNHSHFGGHKWSPSGKTFYYGLRDRNADSWDIIAVDQNSGIAKTIYKSGDFYTISISPDGQWFALTCPSNEDAHIKIVSTNGDESRELYRFKPGIDLGRVPSTTWTADGKYILFGLCDNEVDEETYELCRISVDGGEFEKLGLKKKGVFLNLSAHPDGRHIAYSSDENIAEIWVMENFLPEN